MDLEVEWGIFKLYGLTEELWIALVIQTIVRVWIYVFLVELFVLRGSAAVIVPAVAIASILSIASVTVIIFSTGTARPSVVKPTLAFVTVATLVAIAAIRIIVIIVVLTIAAILLIVSATMIATIVLIVALIGVRVASIHIIFTFGFALFVLCTLIDRASVSLAVGIGCLRGAFFASAGVLSCFRRASVVGCRLTRLRLVRLLAAVGHANLNLIVFLIIVVVTLVLPVDCSALLGRSVGFLVAFSITPKAVS